MNLCFRNSGYNSELSTALSTPKNTNLQNIYKEITNKQSTILPSNNIKITKTHKKTKTNFQQSISISAKKAPLIHNRSDNRLIPLAKYKQKIKPILDCQWQNGYPSLNNPQFQYITYNIFISIYTNWLRLEPYLRHLLKNKSKLQTIEQIRRIIDKKIQLFNKKLQNKRVTRLTTQNIPGNTNTIQRFDSGIFIDEEEQGEINHLQKLINTLFTQNNIKKQVIDGMHIGSCRKIKTLKQNKFAKQILETKDKFKKRKISAEDIVANHQNLNTLLDTLLERIHLVKYLTGRKRKIQHEIAEPLKNLFNLNKDKKVNNELLVDDIMEIFSQMKASSIKKDNTRENRKNSDIDHEDNTLWNQKEILADRVQKQLFDGYHHISAKKKENRVQLQRNDDVSNYKQQKDNYLNGQANRQLKQKYQSKLKLPKNRRTAGNSHHKQIKQIELNQKRNNKQLDKPQIQKSSNNNKSFSSIHQSNTSIVSSYHSKKSQKKVKFMPKNEPVSKIHANRTSKQNKNVSSVKNSLKLKDQNQTIIETLQSNDDEAQIIYRRKKIKRRRKNKGRFSMQDNNHMDEQQQIKKINNQKALAQILTFIVQRKVNRRSTKKSTVRLTFNDQDDESYEQQSEQNVSGQKQKKVKRKNRKLFKFGWNTEQLLSMGLPLEKQVQITTNKSEKIIQCDNVFSYLADFSKQAGQKWFGYGNNFNLCNQKKNIYSNQQVLYPNTMFNLELIRDPQEEEAQKLQRKLQNDFRNKFALQTKMIQFSKSHLKYNRNIVAQMGLETHDIYL